MHHAQPSLGDLASRQRLVFRCVAEFVLDELREQIRRYDGHFLQAAIGLAVLQASRTPGRSISVRALAHSLRLPYESTRRHVRALEELGLCERVSASSVTSTPLAAAFEAERGSPQAALGGLRRLYRALTEMGVEPESLAGMSVRPARPAPPGAVAPLVASLVTDFLLRAIEECAPWRGALADGLIFAALMQLNVAPITYDPTLAWRYAGRDTPPPDALRQPASLSEVAARLGIAKETVRRRMLRFLDDGRVERTEGGYLASMAFLQQPEMLRCGLGVTRRFGQLARALQDAGVSLGQPAPEPAALRA